MEKYLGMIHSDSDFKGTMGRPLSSVLYFNLQILKDKRLIICRETYMLIPVVIFAQKDFFLLDAFNEKLDIMNQAGLIDFWYKKDFKNIDLRDEITKSPKVLSLTDFLACFQVLIFGLIASFIVFLIELIRKVCK